MFFLQLLSSPQLQPIILHVGLSSYAIHAIKNSRFAAISVLGEHGRLAVIFANIAEFFHKVSKYAVCLMFSRKCAYIYQCLHYAYIL